MSKYLNITFTRVLCCQCQRGKTWRVKYPL